jgi:hypothetical protein
MYLLMSGSGLLTQRRSHHFTSSWCRDMSIIYLIGAVVVILVVLRLLGIY